MKNKNNGGIGMAIILTMVILLGIGGIMKAIEPKCSIAGCDNGQTGNSRYCVLHDISYRSYGNPDYNAVYKESQRKQREAKSRTTIDYSSTSSPTSGSNGNEYKSSSNRSYTTKTYDPYDVNDYNNGDDFADEWAEEFGDGSFDDGYDDAYEYWDEEYEEE